MARIHAICVDQQMVLGRNNRTTCPITNGVELLISLDASFYMKNRINIIKRTLVSKISRNAYLLLNKDKVSHQNSIFQIDKHNSYILSLVRIVTLVQITGTNHERVPIFKENYYLVLPTLHFFRWKSTYGPLAIFPQ